MALDEFADFLAHTVKVKPYVGTGGYGPVLGDQVTLSPEDGTGVLVDEETRLVRTSDGTEAVSSTTIIARPAQADLLTAGSEVELPSGDTTTILTRSVVTTPGLDGMPEHVEAACE